MRELALGAMSGILFGNSCSWPRLSRRGCRLAATLNVCHTRSPLESLSDVATYHVHDSPFMTAMESSTESLATNPPYSASSSRSRSTTKIVDDVTSLTSFNPFSEEDEHDQSSYALVSSLFSKVKNSLSAPLSSAAPSSLPAYPTTAPEKAPPELRRPSLQFSNSNQSNKSGSDRANPFSIVASNPAPPLVSLTPVVSETPSYAGDDRPPSRGGFYRPDTPDGGGYSIPGFPIQDSDARSIRTNVSLRRSASVSKVIRRIRGEGK